MNNNSDSSFDFYSEYDNGSRRVDKTLRKSQVTLERLGLIFKLQPSTIYLTAELGPSEFPSPNGRFECLDFLPTSSMIRVEGEAKESNPSAPVNYLQPAPALPSQFGSYDGNLSSFGAFRRNSSSPSLPTPRRRNAEQHSLKVTLADYRNRKIGEHLRAKYFIINDATANVESIQRLAREGFGDETLVLVQSNGLLFEDSDATRDFWFWKNNSRRVFAVKEVLTRRLEDERPAEPPLQDERQSPSLTDQLRNISSRLDSSIVVSVEGGQILSRAIGNTVMGEKLSDSFKCLICQSFVTTNTVFMSCCCKQVLGCETCVDRWLVSHTTCPHCRSEGAREKLIKYNCFGPLLSKYRDMLP